MYRHSLTAETNNLCRDTPTGCGSQCPSFVIYCACAVYRQRGAAKVNLSRADQNRRFTLDSGDSVVIYDSVFNSKLRNIEETETQGKINQTEPKLITQLRSQTPTTDYSR